MANALKNIRPPRLARKTLLAFLREDLTEEVLGDLDEKFYSLMNKGSVYRAKVNYWFQVFNYLRPFAIRKSQNTQLNHYSMFQNYFKIGYRNLLRNKGYSFINIGGLAVGIAVAMLIGLWIYDELSVGSYHPKADKVAQVLQHQTFNGHTGTQTAIPIPLGAELQKSYGDDFKYVVMSSWTGVHILTFGENAISKMGNYIDLDGPRLLALKMISGSLDGLKDPGSIMLSQSVAKALFGSTDPMNQLVRIDNKLDVKVTGVYEDLPENCDVFNELKFLAPWELYVASEPWIKYAKEKQQWGNNSFQLFVQISDQTEMDKVSDKIKNVKYDLVDEGEKVFKPQIVLLGMKDWHLRSDFEEGVQSGGRIEYVWLFGIVGAFVLLLACINFMNLSTARSEQRAKEVGIRKSIGSVRRQLVTQFLSESFLVVILAFLFSIGLVYVAIPWFNDLAGKQIVFPLSNIYFWSVSFSFIIVTGLLAGSYPALYLSSFQPVKVLKGTFRAGRYASLPRKVLVVLQFTVSVTLIIGTIIVYNQVQHTQNRPLGYDKNGMIMIEMRSPDFYGKYDLLRNELKKSGAIVEMAESSSPLTGIWSHNGGFDWDGRDPDLQPEFGTIWVSHDYGKTIGWTIKEGRDFSREFSTDSSALLINEAAVKFMDIEDPVGKTVRWSGKEYRIIGVVKDMVMENPYKAVKQTVYLLDYKNVNWIDLKLNPDYSLLESVAKAEAAFKKLLPDVPFDYQFAYEEHAKKFSAEVQVGRLSAIFAVLAVLISCLGLFGLASFVAEQRTKEIGIRKVLGASVAGLWKMLSRDFVALVIIACIIAIPLAYYGLSNWLERYEYRTHVSWWTFGISILGAVIITLATVSYQAIRAALMNPVKSLRSE
jgi:ABC-type antimicrobial peptide transport system permease subunit